MAKLIGGLKIIGKIGNLSCYQLPGSDKVYVRSKSGPSSHKYKTSPKFAGSRRQNSEFTGASKSASRVNHGLGEVKLLRTGNIYPDLVRFTGKIQKMDTVSKGGQRAVLFSSFGKLLDGFNINQTYSFDSILRYPLTFSISRETMTASVEIPDLIPGFNFYPDKNQSLYRLRVAFIMLPDLVFGKYGYQPIVDISLLPKEIATDWHTAIQKSEATSLSVSLPYSPEVNSGLLLSIGIEYGVQLENGDVKRVLKAGSGKILAVR